MIVTLKSFSTFLVVLYMDRLLPLEQGSKDFQARWDVATGIVESSDSPDDWALLAKIARWESVYRPEVFTCKVKSSIGAAGPFQVLPRTFDEQNVLCTDFAESARLALDRVKESRHICNHLPKPEQLAQYVTGSCKSALGKAQSRMRYATWDSLMNILSR